MWWLLPIVLFAMSLAYAQYYYKSSFKNDLSFGKTCVLASLRTLVYIVLLFLLLNPRIKYSNKRIEKPLLIWAQDNSQSLKLNADSNYYTQKYANVIDFELNKLRAKYEVQKLIFGQDVMFVDAFDFSDPVSDYASLFTYLENNIQTAKRTQIVLAGDGLYNKGNDPRFLVQEIKSPVHTLALGDKTKQKDVSILTLRANKLAFMKSNMPVSVAIKADFCLGEKLEFKFLSGSKVLYSDTLSVTTDDFFIEKSFFISPNKPGLQAYQFRIKSLKGESNLKNNNRGLHVDVLNNQRKIAICYDSYHPDLAALQSALKDKSNFDVRLIDVSKQQVDFSKFNLMILYQLPSSQLTNETFIKQLKRTRLPFMMVLGGNTDINKLNELDLGLSLTHENDFYQDAKIEFASNFSLFETETDVKKGIESFPPLLSPMAKFRFKLETNILGTQQIKGISTQQPLLVFSQKEEQKQCYILGEGIWRWKLYDYRMNNSHDHFNKIIHQMVQYLALRVKKNQLRIQYDKIYKEIDEIEIEAELYNKSYQTINTADLEFLLKNEKDELFAYEFERSDRVYKLNLNNLPKGNYQFEIKTKAFDQDLSEKGAFIVRSENLEAKALKANPTLLKNISDLSGGLHTSLANISDLTEVLLNNDSIKSRVSYDNKLISALNFIFILCFVSVLLVLEWFLKKYWLGI